MEKSKAEAERLSGVAENTGTAESEVEMELEGRDRVSATTFSRARDVDNIAG